MSATVALDELHPSSSEALKRLDAGRVDLIPDVAGDHGVEHPTVEVSGAASPELTPRLRDWAVAQAGG